jgi:hypothetical protein
MLVEIRTRWAGHVTRIREINSYKILVIKLQEKIRVGELGIDGWY